MKWMIALAPLVACTVLFAGRGRAPVMRHNETRDSVIGMTSLATYVFPESRLYASSYDLRSLDQVMLQERITRFRVGYTRTGREIAAYYVPGKSRQTALVLGGMHGSELSSIEVAYRLLQVLLEGEQPWYSTIIVPSLFPDNAWKALQAPGQINSVANIGRYSHEQAPDPNRQMPSPGEGFEEHAPFDHMGRQIEPENQAMLQLIQLFRPQRIANLHAIRDTTYGGVYADPRTDAKGLALGFDTDSSLAVNIAKYIFEGGGRVAGNRIGTRPTALYYKDPKPAPAGRWQPRNMTGSALKAGRGSGVSLGTWASTAVDKGDTGSSRQAMRLLTIEYPGCKRPVDYPYEAQQLFQQWQTSLFANAIARYFLGNYYPEDTPGNMVIAAKR